MLVLCVHMQTCQKEIDDAKNYFLTPFTKNNKLLNNECA